MSRYTHEDIMSILKSVPGVSEHLNKPSVAKAKENAKRLLEDKGESK